jgi:hypothetical protein
MSCVKCFTSRWLNQFPGRKVGWLARPGANVTGLSSLISEMLCNEISFMCWGAFGLSRRTICTCQNSLRHLARLSPPPLPRAQLEDFETPRAFSCVPCQRYGAACPAGLPRIQGIPRTISPANFDPISLSARYCRSTPPGDKTARSDESSCASVRLRRRDVRRLIDRSHDP